MSFYYLNRSKSRYSIYSDFICSFQEINDDKAYIKLLSAVSDYQKEKKSEKKVEEDLLNALPALTICLSFIAAFGWSIHLILKRIRKKSIQIPSPTSRHPNEVI